MVIVQTIAFLFVAWLFSYVWKFYQTYRAARASGLPYIICPVDPENIMYVLVKASLRKVFDRVLPTWLNYRIQLSIMGWEFRQKHSVHARLGNAFILVTPTHNELYCADPAMADVILTSRNDFVMPPMAMKVLSFLGGNILVSNGDSWSRQRRIVAPNLNERISEIVWNESAVQASQMADYMLSQPDGQSGDITSSLKAVAINVLGQVAYGQPKAFQPLKLPTESLTEVSYSDAISLVTQLIILAALVPRKILNLPIMPKLVRTLGAVLEKLPSLTKEMLDQERSRNISQSAARDNIMSMLVRLSDKGKDQEGHGKSIDSHSQYLTDDEISGNMFIFTAAGFETTANTMVYAVALLSAYPQWQHWVQEEIDMVLGPLNQEKIVDYATYYPKLTRCLALMYETLRLFPAAEHISRATQTVKTIDVNGNTYHIPAKTTVYISNPSLLTNPDFWGADSYEFRPSRWITEDSVLGNSQTITPAHGTFLPWSGGPRVCPGQKMAQVEFVTVISTLLRKCSVEPVVSSGETADQARARIIELVHDSDTMMTLQLNRPKDLHLRWVKR